MSLAKNKAFVSDPLTHFEGEVSIARPGFTGLHAVTQLDDIQDLLRLEVSVSHLINGVAAARPMTFLAQQGSGQECHQRYDNEARLSEHSLSTLHGLLS
jgi:hypothetical protein